jgi:hypothetical protein
LQGMEIINGSTISRAVHGVFRVVTLGGIESNPPSYDNFLETYRNLSNDEDLVVAQAFSPVGKEKINLSKHLPIRRLLQIVSSMKQSLVWTWLHAT